MDKSLKAIKHELPETTPWFELVSQFRKDVNPFATIKKSWKISDLTFRQKLGKIYTQYVLSKREVKAICKDVQTYGSLIKKVYGTSITRQFFQQSYLFFVLGVRSKYYRRYHLFKKMMTKSEKFHFLSS